jgi:SAM-dependent methyltransferase
MDKKTDFNFADIVFFGRGLEEYTMMFNLKLPEMNGLHFLDCPAGPSAFALEAAAAGLSVVACDPLFAFNNAELRAIVDRDSSAVAEKQARNPQLFHKELVPTVIRRKSMELFLDDFLSGQAAGRYVAASLPDLPFADRAFDVVLSGNLLFLYSDIASGGMLQNSPLDFSFHQRAIAEMMRVCRKDLRIYPLQGPAVVGHAYLQPIIEECRLNGFSAELEPVAQRDIIGAELMLKISH